MIIGKKRGKVQRMGRKMQKVISVLLIIVTLFTGCSGKNVSTDETMTADKTVTTDGDTITEEKSTTDEVTTENAATSTEDVTTTEEVTSTTEEYTGEYVPVTMAFTGDIYLSDKLNGYYEKSGVTGFLSQGIAENFSGVDLMICNHEYASTDLPDSAKDTGQLYNYKAPMSREVIWKDLGVDIVSVANNHALDYGEQSLLDTMTALDKQGIAYVGGGKNLEEAKSAEIRYVNGKKIAILAATRFILNYQWYAQENKPGLMTTYESTNRFQMMKEEIRRLKEEEKCDIVVAYVHFGKEKSYEIIDNQKVIAHGYIDAGADMVVGSHAHNLQGIEIYKNAPIYYNLGNFLFENYPVDTMLVNVKINEDNSIETSIVPCKSQSYMVKEAAGQEAQEIIDFVESISINVQIDEKGNVKEKVVQ